MRKTSLLLEGNVYRGITIVLLLFILGLSPSKSNADSTFIRIASFNIANFGDTEEYKRSLISLVILKV